MVLMNLSILFVQAGLFFLELKVIAGHSVYMVRYKSKTVTQK